MRRILPVALFASVALGLCGCGPGSSSGVSAESGASLVRDDVLAFVSLDSEPASSQWRKLDALAQRFPARGKAIARLKGQLSSLGIDFDRDVKPALGPEVDVVVMPETQLDTPEDTSTAYLTRPADPQKLEGLIARYNRSDSQDAADRVVYREVHGWYVVARSQATIDRVVAEGGGSLADDATFTEALAELPDEALAKAYVNGAQMAATVRAAAAQRRTPLGPDAAGLEKLDFVAASLSAEDEGLRLKGAASGPGTGALGAGDYASSLVHEVPADALGLLAFRGGGLAERFGQLERRPSLAPRLRQLETRLGVPFGDLLELFANEAVAYARPGAGIPELTLALNPSHREKALTTLDKLAARIAAIAGGRVSSGTQAGHEVRTLDLGPVAVRWAARGGTIVITSGATGIADYGSQPRLIDGAAFEDAKAAAGLPDSTGGFLYLDLKSAVSLVESLAGLGGEGLPPEVAANLKPLRALVAWTAGSGDTRTFEAFLQIE